MMDVLFVGPVSGYSSYPVVCKGLLRALVDAGIRPVVADMTWDGSQNHTELSFDDIDESKIVFLSHQDSAKLVRMGDIPTGCDSRFCVTVNPSHTLMGVKTHGIKVLGMFVGDVDVVPDSWLQIMNQCEVVMAPSSWCRNVIMASGVTSKTMVLNHGISSVFAPATNPEIMSGDPDCGFVFLHLCSAVFYPERKGTPQFFEAAEQLVRDGKNIIARVVFGTQTRGIKKLLSNLSPEMKNHTQMYFFSGARPQSDILKIYLGCHAAVFPSRAEGFGCIPLEIRACGIPVVQTMCTGHRDHLDPDDDPSRWGIVEIPHGPLEPAWGSFGKAPTVRSDDVYEAMKKCISNYENLREAAIDMADAVRAQWSWSETTRPLIEFLRKESI